MTMEPLASEAVDWPTSGEVQLNEAVLEALFKNWFKPLCTYCQYRFGFELDVAKEAVHTGFIRLWENREAITPGLCVKSYLYKIITNISLDLLKHEKVKQKHIRHVYGQAALCSADTSHSELKQLGADIDKAVSELPRQMRRIFELSRYEGLKYSEISAKLDISVKTVETQMSRALLKLRHKLSHYITVTLLTVLFNLH